MLFEYTYLYYTHGMIIYNIYAATDKMENIQWKCFSHRPRRGIEGVYCIYIVYNLDEIVGGEN